MDSHACTRTTTALLERLFDAQDDDVWNVFDTRYSPVLLGVARRLGLRDTDAHDAAQETLLSFLGDYRAGKYDRTKGRLGAWLVGILKHRVLALRRDYERMLGESRRPEVVTDFELERAWDEELRAKVLRDAFALLERSTGFSSGTVEAFRRVALDGASPEEVARDLGISTQAVYLARHKCSKRLRSFAEQLEESYEVL